jgi:hypothetical protein
VIVYSSGHAHFDVQLKQGFAYSILAVEWVSKAWFFTCKTPTLRRAAMRKLLHDIASLIGTFVLFGFPIAIVIFITLMGDELITSFKEHSIWFIISSYSKMAVISVLGLILVGGIAFVMFEFSLFVRRSAERMEKPPPPAHSRYARDRSAQLSEEYEAFAAAEHMKLKSLMNPAWEDFGTAEDTRYSGPNRGLSGANRRLSGGLDRKGPKTMQEIELAKAEKIRKNLELLRGKT